MVQRKFKRTNSTQYSKLGVRRRNKQKYRKGTGIDNKVRLKMKGHLRNVNVGFRTAKKTRDLVKELKPITINNVEDLKKVEKGMIGIISKVGNKKRKEILERVVKDNIKINLNAKRVLSKIEDKIKEARKKKEGRKTRKIVKSKKAQKEAEKKAKADAKNLEAEKETNTDNAQKDEAMKDNSKSEDKNKDTKAIENKEGKPNEGKKDTLTNNYGRGK